MERDELLEMAREEIFDKMHEFNYINNIEVIAILFRLRIFTIYKTC